MLLLISIFHFPLFILLFSGCNHDETVPGQLVVGHFTITDTTGAPVPDVEVRDVWVFVDGQALGVFPLPASIPLPYAGRKQLRLYAGVIADRVQAQRVQYPFYGFYQDTIDFAPDTRLTLNPGIKLSREARRPYVFEESFETTPLSVDSGVNGIRRVTLSADGVSPWGGRYYGRVDAPPSTDPTKLLEITQIKSIPLSNSGKAIYLELIYKNSRFLEVGIRAVDVNGQNAGALTRAGFATSTEWKKAYVFLSNTVVDIASQGTFTYKVTLRAQADSANPSFIAVDNMRLVQYK